ncbi:MAG: prolyl oligopeptidase family serine peptidase [Halieaceae bacterium]|jgi:prolyl oligopeptidase|nr:prolyl oligopeptidase family serine peptidase [Halieaceae bacterium]
MTRHRLIPLVALSAILALLPAPAMTGAPPTAREPVAETLHGVRLVDPYRWLEGTEQGDITDEVAAWTDRQNAHTRQVLDQLPGREALEQRLRQLMEVPAVSAPGMYGTRYFYSRREGGQPQAVHYVRDSLDGRERVLLDPQAIDPTGLTTVAWTAPGNDGRLMAFGMYRSGDENSVLYVMDVDSGDWLAEEIPGKVGLVRWLEDDSGFYYRRLEDLEDPYSYTVKLHRLGTHHRQDRALFRQRDLDFFYRDLDKSAAELEALKTTWGPGALISRDGKWMAVYYWTGTTGVDLWVARLEQWRRGGELELKPAAIGMQGRLGGSLFKGDKLYLQHAFDAPNGRVSVIDLANPGYDNWRELVPEREDAVIRSTSFARDVVAVGYLANAHSKISLFDLKGKSLGDLDLPGIGSAGLSTAEDRNEAFLVFSSYNMPRSIYHLDLTRAGRTLWARPEVPVDPGAIEVKQVWYQSRDGTPVSMFIVHRKGLKLDGKNPTILYGYGGFNTPLTPGFSATLFPWYEGGGVYAVANLRGGGEYGSAWHTAGMLERKQNVFDDFIAAAQWLIAQGYTNPGQLGIAGGSNGGLLTGAVAVQRPDLFAAVISAVPLLDMLRYQNFLMARYWVPEYGSAEDARQFEFLRAYSPYHNVRPGIKYPAILFTAGENDRRVHPMHARKMAALMQASSASDPQQAPILLWVDRDAGHGAGKPLDLQIRDVADQRIFMMWQLGMLRGK